LSWDRFNLDRNENRYNEATQAMTAASGKDAAIFKRQRAELESVFENCDSPVLEMHTGRPLHRLLWASSGGRC
jgi:hypothetical protein